MTPQNPYLQGIRITICTDHDSLENILNLLENFGRHPQRQLCLSDFSFGVVHRARIKHQGANTLSGLSANKADTVLLDDSLLFSASESPNVVDPHTFYRHSKQSHTSVSLKARTFAYMPCYGRYTDHADNHRVHTQTSKSCILSYDDITSGTT